MRHSSARLCRFAGAQVDPQRHVMIQSCSAHILSAWDATEAFAICSRLSLLTRCTCCRLESMKAAQFSSRGATPHEEQALLKQARSLMAASQDSAEAGGSARGRGRGSRGGRGRGARAPVTAPESPAATDRTPVTQDPTLAEASKGISDS